MRTGLICGVAACALLSVAAHGQSNSAFVDQVSNTVGNTATITQNGGNNVAGAQGDEILQSGDNNQLLIEQGGGDVAGTGGAFGQRNEGIDQLGADNKLTIDQTGVGGSRVFEVQQDSTAGSRNVATVTQSGNAAISQLNQTNDGGGGANTATLTQTGSQFQRNVIGDASGFQNEDRGLFQVGADNTAIVTQNGANNTLNRLEQDGDANSFTLNQQGFTNLVDVATQQGSDNVADLAFDGDRNGLTGDFSGDALSVGLTKATVTQTGIGNNLYFDVDGADNLFAFEQTDNDNAITGVVDGGFNQVAVSQSTVGNDVTFSQTGTGNNLGVTQN